MVDLIKRLNDRTSLAITHGWDGHNIFQESADTIVKLQEEVLHWQKLGNDLVVMAENAVHETARSTDLLGKKCEEVDRLMEICKQQNKTMLEMSHQIDELAELSGITSKSIMQ